MAKAEFKTILTRMKLHELYELMLKWLITRIGNKTGLCILVSELQIEGKIDWREADELLFDMRNQGLDMAYFKWGLTDLGMKQRVRWLKKRIKTLKQEEKNAKSTARI